MKGKKRREEIKRVKIDNWSEERMMESEKSESREECGGTEGI